MASERGVMSLTFKRHLVLPGLVLIVLEPLLVVWPVLSLFHPTDSQRALLLSAVAPVLAFSVIAWYGVMTVRLLPLTRAIALRKRGEPVDDKLRARAFRVIGKIALFALWLRTALWMLAATALGWWVAKNDPDWPMARVVTLASVVGLHAFLVNIVRAVWYAKVYRRVKRDLFPNLDPVWEFADNYVPRIVLHSLVFAAAALGALAAFVYYFLPIGPDQYLQVMTYLPGALVGVATIGNAYARRTIEPIEAYFRSERGPEKDRIPLGPHPAPVAAYEMAQTLPYRLAVAKVVVWTVAAAGGAALVRYGHHMELDNAILMFCAAVVIVVGAAIYEAVWHRNTMRPILAYLVERHRLPIRSLKSALSLRTKLLISFGGLVLFACGLSLFWGFVQYKKLVTRFVERQASLKLDWVTTEVGRQLIQADEPASLIVERVLREASAASMVDGAVYVFVPIRGGRALSLGGGLEGVPRLPWYALARLRAFEKGAIEINAARLAGNYKRLRVNIDTRESELGAVAVLYPGYRGRGPGIQRPLVELVVFFVLLFSVCGGFVILTVREYTRPIRHLEQRADEMARGELSQPVVTRGEADEIGRLTSAIEEMRQALQGKIHTIEGLNVDLENQVQVRTADLERKNHELGQALTQLRQAQSQLVRSEKMASIGQLVAGIAHEINNPVNAIVNTVGPLNDSLAELVRVSGETGQGSAEVPDPGDAGEGPSARRLGSEIEQMVRVIQRGADRTKGIVQALHNYSRADDEKVVDFDLNRGLDDSLELLRHQLKHHTTVERSYGDVGRIRGHAGQIHQVFMNLFTNAAQALVGREGAKIRVSTERVGDNVKICVADNGPGIPEEVLDKIFDPFFTTKDVGEGSGLGLSIVHGIVDRHGGTVDVHSVIGEGTTFIVTLPLTQA